MVLDKVGQKERAVFISSLFPSFFSSLLGRRRRREGEEMLTVGRQNRGVFKMNRYLAWAVLWSMVFIADCISIGWFIGLLLLPPAAAVILIHISMQEDE